MGAERPSNNWRHSGVSGRAKKPSKQRGGSARKRRAGQHAAPALSVSQWLFSALDTLSLAVCTVYADAADDNKSARHINFPSGGGRVLLAKCGASHAPTRHTKGLSQMQRVTITSMTIYWKRWIASGASDAAITIARSDP